MEINVSVEYNGELLPDIILSTRCSYYIGEPFWHHEEVLSLCVFSSHSFWTSSSLDVPAGVTQEEGHTGFLIHLLSAVCALFFFSRQPMFPPKNI